MERLYRVNEAFLSVQGEGIRQGEESLFLRFSGCNMRCAMQPGPKSPGGFDCDTEFASGITRTLDDLMSYLDDVCTHDCDWVVLTGGEPLLQVDQPLIDRLKHFGMMIQVETNGSLACGVDGVDLLTVSPKVAEHCIAVDRCGELKYVRSYGQALPVTKVIADHYWISPAFNGSSLDEATLTWCKKLVADSDGKWKLSVQMHKAWGVQ